MAPEENRTRVRLPVSCRVFIEVLAAAAGSNQEPEIIACETLDVSATGLKVGLQRELTQHSILQIGVEPPDSADTFYLTAEVRWCRHSGTENKHWYAGLELLNAHGSDSEHWKELIGSLED